MSKCESCANAVWDYEEYYGTTRKQYFVDGCKLDNELCESGECDDYIEEREEWFE